MSFTNVNSFDRAAQASAYLDQVLQALHDQSRQRPGATEAIRINADLQSFLGILMEQSRSSKGKFYGAIAISLR